MNDLNIAIKEIHYIIVNLPWCVILIEGNV